MVLLDANVEGDIISLGPPSQGVEQEDWLLVAALNKLASGVLDEEEEEREFRNKGGADGGGEGRGLCVGRRRIGERRVAQDM